MISEKETETKEGFCRTLVRNMCSCQGAERESQQFPVAMAKGFHLFPYRTQKLRPSAPMVLGWTRPGRVGRRRIPRALHKECSFFVVQDERKLRMRSILMRSTHFGSFEANRRCGGRCCDDSVLRKYAPDAFHANLPRMNCAPVNVLLIIRGGIRLRASKAFPSIMPG